MSIIEQSLAFAPIRAQTEAYLQWCQEQWERNVAQTCEYICELTGFDLATSFTVYVTHPSLCNGSYLGEHNIQWGHHEDWPLYTTVYLWHEILHSYFCPGDLNHALIQLLTDNELRVRLNEGASYPPFVGHPRLFPLMHALLPDWRAYLAEAHKDIRQLEARLQPQKLVS